MIFDASVVLAVGVATAAALAPDAGNAVLTYGACGVGEAARSYQHAGFTVLPLVSHWPSRSAIAG